MVSLDLANLGTTLSEEDRKLLKDNQERVNKYVTLFFSFDIVNSTHYKTIALTDSLEIIQKIFGQIEKLMSDNIEGIQYWRSIGDEIIFYLEILDKNEIINAVDTVFSILNKVREMIRNGEIKIDGNKAITYRYPEIISLKATAWLALIGDSEGSLNRKYANGIMLNDKRLEFQGHDIDIGFRVAENTRNRRFALNFELAYFLSKYESYKDNLKFMGYKCMKGVWNERKYPIIWYHNTRLKELKGFPVSSPDDNIINSFEESFFYDEEDFCELTSVYLDGDKGKEIRKVKINELLDKISNNLNLKNKIEDIEREINNKEGVKRSIVQGVKKEIHSVVICKNQNSIICFKRKKDNRYDFGCVKIDLEGLETSLEDRLKNEYFESFDADLKGIKIYRTYYIDNKEKKVTGLRFVGDLKNNPQNLKDSKYTEVKVVNLENYKDLVYIDQEEFESIIEELLGVKKND